MRRVAHRPGALVRAAVTGGALGLLVFALFLLLNQASLGRDLPTARAQVADAFASGALQDEDWRYGDTNIGRHQYNDCLILWQALDQRAPSAQLAVSPLLDLPQAAESRCARLRRFVAGEIAGDPVFYHRYLHAHTTVARILLPILSVAQIRTLYHSTLTLLVLAGIALSLTALARRRTPEALFWLIVFLVFSRWFGLESYGQSLGHGPADIVHLSFLLVLAAAAARGGLSAKTAILMSGLFGAGVMLFEFLTGGIPLGLAAVIGGLPFALRRTEGERVTDRIAEAAIAFCAGAGACLLAKLGLALAVFGPGPLLDYAGQLGARMGLLNHAEMAGVGPLDLAKKLAKGVNGLAAGMHLMAGFMLVLAVAAGGWGYARTRAAQDPELKRAAAALLLSNLAIAALLALFWQHTVVHAWFMVRTLTWTIASGFALFALALWQVNSGERSSTVQPRSG